MFEPLLNDLFTNERLVARALSRQLRRAIQIDLNQNGTNNENVNVPLFLFRQKQAGQNGLIFIEQRRR